MPAKPDLYLLKAKVFLRVFAVSEVTVAQCSMSFRIPRFYQEMDGFVCGDSSGHTLTSFCCQIKFYNVPYSVVLVVQFLRQQAATLLPPQHPKQDEASA